MLEQNQQLREEIQSLRKLINEKNFAWSIESVKDDIPTRDCAKKSPRTKSKHDLNDLSDGVASTSGFQREVTLCVEKVTSDTEIRVSPRRQKSEIASPTYHDDGGVLAADDGTYYSPQNHINALKREIKKLQDENEQMNDVYESHMRVCNSSMKKASSTNLSNLETLNGELKKQLQVKEKCRQELERMLIEEKNRNSNLQEELHENRCGISDENIKYIENAVKILQQRSGGDTEILNSVIQQFSSDITENFLHVQESIQSAHNCTREKLLTQIIDKLDRIPRGGGVRTPKSDRKGESGFSPRKESKATFRTRDNYKQHKEPGGCISELENIKGSFV